MRCPWLSIRTAALDAGVPVVQPLGGHAVFLDAARILSHLPRELPGVDVIEWLVVNDGSRDRTVEVAEACGVELVLSDYWMTRMTESYARRGRVMPPNNKINATTTPAASKASTLEPLGYQTPGSNPQNGNLV